MVSHIAVLTTDGAMLEAMEPSLAEAALRPAHADSADQLPPATVGVVATPETAAQAVPILAALGQWHEELLLLIAQAIDCREAFEPGSSVRVRDHARRFSAALALNTADALTFERSALLRDIGKASIPNEVLLKSGPLTYDEWKTLQDHATFGAELVRSTGVLRDTADIIQNHHECFDGTGYPAGLEGEQIPRLARALKLVDVYCAMTSPRAYRSTVTSHEEALGYLLSESGKHFDPELVTVFVESEAWQPTTPAT